MISSSFSEWLPSCLYSLTMSLHLLHSSCFYRSLCFRGQLCFSSSSSFFFTSSTSSSSSICKPLLPFLCTHTQTYLAAPPYRLSLLCEKGKRTGQRKRRGKQTIGEVKVSKQRSPSLSFRLPRLSLYSSMSSTTTAHASPYEKPFPVSQHPSTSSSASPSTSSSSSSVGLLRL